MIDSRLIQYLEKHNSLIFSSYFYELNLSYKDQIDFDNYRKVILYYNKGLANNVIAQEAKLSKSLVDKWVSFSNIPRIIHFIQIYLKNSSNRDFKILPFQCSKGGKIKEILFVPYSVKSFYDVEYVIDQIQNFNYDLKSDCLISKLESFAYLIGFMIGDSTKSKINRKYFTNRRIQIRLSKRFDSNRILGNYVAFCSNSLNLRMIQIKDCPKGKCNPYDFYSWSSQSSPFIQWIFHDCLGLKTGDLTTYDPINCSWLLESPYYFKIAFLQGLADSDGYVDFSSRTIGIITTPNTLFVERLLKSIDIKSKYRFFSKNKLEALIINRNDAYYLPIFNPYVKSYRYCFVERLYFAKKYHRWPCFLKLLVQSKLSKGIKGTKLIKEILFEEGIIISPKNLKKMGIKNEI